MPSCDYFISTPERCFAEDGGSQMFHWLRDSYGYDTVSYTHLDVYKRQVPECAEAHDTVRQVYIA